jgi:hypothetical protein
MEIAEKNGFSVSALIIMFFLVRWFLFPGLDESPYFFAQSEYLVSFSIPLLYITYANIRMGRYGLEDVLADLKSELNSPAKDWLLGVFVTLFMSGWIVGTFLFGVALVIIGVARVFGISNYSLYEVDWGMWALIAQVAIIFAVRVGRRRG